MITKEITFDKNFTLTIPEDRKLPVLWNFDENNIIGQTTEIKKDGDKLIATIKIADHMSEELVNEFCSLNPSIRDNNIISVSLNPLAYDR